MIDSSHNFGAANWCANCGVDWRSLEAGQPCKGYPKQDLSAVQQVSGTNGRRLTDLLALSHIPRWVIVPRLKEQSVADHSYRVAVILLELFERLRIDPVDPNWLVWALLHDAHECRTGDLPSSANFSILAQAAYESNDARYPDVDDRKVKDILEQEVARQQSPWMQRLQPPTGVGLTIFKLADLIETYTWIKQWGHGHHAQGCQLRTHDRVQYFIDKLTGELGRVDDTPATRPAIEQLISEIIEELGR